MLLRQRQHNILGSDIRNIVFSNNVATKSAEDKMTRQRGRNKLDNVAQQVVAYYHQSFFQPVTTYK